MPAESLNFGICLPPATMMPHFHNWFNVGWDGQGESAPRNFVRALGLIATRGRNRSPRPPIFSETNH